MTAHQTAQSAALFDLDPAQVRLNEISEDLSADRKRTIRQAQAITNGQHPLSLLFGHMPLHADAAIGDRQAEGLRCGTCRFRELIGHHDCSHPKCTLGAPARISHGAGTDVRAWWPACRDHEATDA